MKKTLILLCFVSGTSFAAVEMPTCSIAENGDLTGNYNAIQQQAYNSSCILKSVAEPYNDLVPIGNSGGSISRINVTTSIYEPDGDESIKMKLNGPEDNTLSKGQRGRQEVSSCFITDTEFNELSPEEKDFRKVSSDFYRGCTQASQRTVSYDFYLKLSDTPENSYMLWDSIIMQLHAQNDKDRYCIPNNETAPELCNINNGTVSTVERTRAAYERMLANKAVFEKDVQPPLSFRIKDGEFMIIATSGLTDSSGNKSDFTSTKNCSINAKKAVVGVTKTCPETGKTSTLLYRSKLEDKFPANNYLHFKISIEWPSKDDNYRRIKVMYTQPGSSEEEILVDRSDIPFGTYDNAYPYFKAGVYRQNGNSIPTSVELVHFRIMPFSG